MLRWISTGRSRRVRLLHRHLHLVWASGQQDNLQPQDCGGLRSHRKNKKEIRKKYEKRRTYVFPSFSYVLFMFLSFSCGSLGPHNRRNAHEMRALVTGAVVALTDGVGDHV